MLKWTNPVNDINYNEIHRTEFESSRFSDGNKRCRIEVFADNPSLIGYAEKCITAFESISDEAFDRILSGLAAAFRESCIDKGQGFSNERKVLSVCRSVTMYVCVPSDDSILLYVLECKGDGAKSGFVMLEDSPVYIGKDYFQKYRLYKEKHQ